jgi:hypothetical protein
MPNLSSYLKAAGIGVVIAVVGIAAYLQFGDAAPQIADEELPAVTVYKSPTCQCCAEWVTHMEDNGFEVKTTDLSDMQQIKNRFSVPRELSSCHTAVVGGYVVEGHVPAEEVKRMLVQQPQIVGLTVPGMPVGSPGMERGNQLDPYNVLAFSQNGRANIFAKYNQ